MKNKNLLSLLALGILFAFCVFGTALRAEAGCTATTLSLSSSPNPSTQNQIITFIATVTGTAGGQPSGTVVFKDSGTAISGSIAASAAAGNTSTASFSTSSLSVGSHSISADFTGTGWANSTASAIVQVVSLATTKPTSTSHVQTVIKSFGAISSQVIDSVIDSAVSSAFSPDSANNVRAVAGGLNLHYGGADPTPFKAIVLAKNDVSGLKNPVVNDATDTLTPPSSSGTEKQRWSIWLDLRETGAKQSSSAPSGQISGNHFNLTAGLTRKLSSDFLVGIVTSRVPEAQGAFI
jgi:hypothetical protein